MNIKTELELSQSQSENYLKLEKQLKEDLENSKSYCTDLQRAEQVVRIDLEKIQHKVKLIVCFIFLIFVCK